MIKLSPEDEKLLRISDLQLAADCLRRGSAHTLAKVCEDAHAEIASLRTRLAEVEGWKLVPVEPTDEMMQAGYRSYGQSLYRNRGHGEEAIELYRAMLRASPSPPRQEQEERK